MANELKFFAMDEERDTFVIFELDRGTDTNLYLWVDYDAENIRVTTVTGLYSYMNHTASPLYVREGDGEEIEMALKVLDGIPVEKINESITKCLKDVDKVCENRPGWAEEIEDMESKTKEEVEKAKESNSGLWS